MAARVDADAEADAIVGIGDALHAHDPLRQQAEASGSVILAVQAENERVDRLGIRDPGVPEPRGHDTESEAIRDGSVQHRLGVVLDLVVLDAAAGHRAEVPGDAPHQAGLEGDVSHDTGEQHRLRVELEVVVEVGPQQAHHQPVRGRVREPEPIVDGPVEAPQGLRTVRDRRQEAMRDLEHPHAATDRLGRGEVRGLGGSEDLYGAPLPRDGDGHGERQRERRERRDARRTTVDVHRLHLSCRELLDRSSP